MYEFLLRKIDNFIYKIRILHYRKVFLSLGNSSRIYGRIRVFYPENIAVGNFTTLNEGAILNARAHISIGNNVHISSGVIINTGGLDYLKKGDERIHNSNPVKISDGVWLGSGVIINPGVSIGENSVIGAGAVVTKDIPANCVAVGVPAKVVKNI